VWRSSIPYSPYARQVDAPITHLTAGHAHTQIRAASAVADAAIAQLDRYEVDGTDPLTTKPVNCTPTPRTSGTPVVQRSRRYRASDASAITKRQPLQLIARNCRASSLHSANNFDTWVENIGRTLCGVEAEAISMSVLERRS
jgi:3-hydroxy-9,10-secoandrosta-1,3,5(10)-triene-9,17-dione monooxygenase